MPGRRYKIPPPHPWELPTITEVPEIEFPQVGAIAKDFVTGMVPCLQEVEYLPEIPAENKDHLGGTGHDAQGCSHQDELELFFLECGAQNTLESSGGRACRRVRSRFSISKARSV